MVDKRLSANAAAGAVLVVLQVVILAIVCKVDFTLHRISDDASPAASKVTLYDD
jgi:hypothetical protein